MIQPDVAPYTGRIASVVANDYTGQDPFDLRMYLARIRYSGSSYLEPSLETLAELQRLHMAAIPFENIAAYKANLRRQRMYKRERRRRLIKKGLAGVDALPGQNQEDVESDNEGLDSNSDDENIDIREPPLRLAPRAIWHKLVIQRRGGWCYEQNTLFERVLREIGFDVLADGARVISPMPSTAATATTEKKAGDDIPEAATGMTATAAEGVIGNGQGHAGQDMNKCGGIYGDIQKGGPPPRIISSKLPLSTEPISPISSTAIETTDVDHQSALHRILPPATHKALIITIPNHHNQTKAEYLVDVGFGGAGAPRVPIPMHDGAQVSDPKSGDAYRLVAQPVRAATPSSKMVKWGLPAFLISESASEGIPSPARFTPESNASDFYLYVSPSTTDAWHPTYHFSTRTALPASDAELANHFCDTSVLSVVGGHLMVSIMTELGRKTILDNVYSEVSHTGRTKRTLNNVERRNVLRDEFGIRL